MIATLINFNGSLNGAWIMISGGVLLFLFIVMQRFLLGSFNLGRAARSRCRGEPPCLGLKDRRPRPRAHLTTSARLPTDARVRRGGEQAPVEHNIHSYLANNLGREIVGGTYPPGSLLPAEGDLLARFSVSRTALREAYRGLAAKGLILSRSKVGTRVRPKTDWNMLDPEVLAWHLQAVPTEDLVADLYVLRQIIEPAAAALAAAGPAGATLDRIAAAYADMERFKDGDGDLIAADLRFHLAILEATGNHFLSALGGLIHAALLATFKLSWAGAARIQDDRLHQHKAIFEAIRDGLPERAHDAMAELLRDSINDVHEFLNSRAAVDASAAGGRLTPPPNLARARSRIFSASCADPSSYATWRLRAAAAAAGPCCILPDFFLAPQFTAPVPRPCRRFRSRAHHRCNRDGRGPRA